MININFNELAPYAPKRLVVAYSGGLDSHVLLHALQATLAESDIALSLLAVHVDHQLHPSSKQWQQHCKDFCEEYHIPYQRLTLVIEHEQGCSLEAQARDARYQALANVMQCGDCLVTAHHEDDQAETLLLQLLRGAGVDGLAAMPLIKPFAQAIHWRPLLDCCRGQLQQYATEQSLTWVDDPSNQQIDFDRNFLRHEIFPKLKQRWPSCNTTLARSATHCANASAMLTEQAQIDCKRVKGSLGAGDYYTLDITACKQLSKDRLQGVIRFWLKDMSFALPSEKKMSHILSDVIDSRQDVQGCVTWANVECRRYDNQLYCFPTRDEVHGMVQELSILGDTNCIKLSHGELHITAAQATMISDLTIRYRQGGETLLINPALGHQSLKKLMQQWKMPPWLRSVWPLVYHQDKLVCIPNYQIASVAIPLRNFLLTISFDPNRLQNYKPLTL